VKPCGFIRRTVLPGEVHSGDRAGDSDAVHLRRYLLDRERHRRIIEPDREVHLVDIKPLARDRRADVSLALMVPN
jgi:hypothetical protein